MEGYKSLLSYKLTLIAFGLTWEFVPEYYFKIEDGRQRDQLNLSPPLILENLLRKRQKYLQKFTGS